MKKILKKVEILASKMKKKKRIELCYSIEQELKKLNSENKLLVRENQDLKKEISNLKKHPIAGDQTKDRVKENQRNMQVGFEEGIKIYLPVVRTMFQCKSCDNLMSGFGIHTDCGMDDIKNLIRIVGMIGNSTSFANIVCSYYEGRKQRLGEDEVRFFDSLNQFYRNIYKINYNVIFCPKTDGKDNKFNKQLMKDNDKRAAVFSCYREVYAPGIMRNSKSVERMAIVRGYN